MSTINCDSLLSAKVEGICFIFKVFYFLFPIGAGNQMGLLWNVFPSGIHCLWAPHEMSGLEEWRIQKCRSWSCGREGREPWLCEDSLGISWRRSIKAMECLWLKLLKIQFCTIPDLTNICYLSYLPFQRHLLQVYSCAFGNRNNSAHFWPF